MGKNPDKPVNKYIKLTQFHKCLLHCDVHVDNFKTQYTIL